MSQDFHVIIPARYQSSRLPGKLLMDLNGRTVIERVYRQVLSSHPSTVTIATDHEEIAEHGRALGATVMMTSANHQSGSDRLAEVITKGSFAADDIIVNVQGDEPFIHPELVQQVASRVETSKAAVATLCWPINDESSLENPNVVKVVRNQHEQALYFSRAPIPYYRNNSSIETKQVFRHIGLYAYRAEFVLDYVSWPQCELETAEGLEQLRMLWAGVNIDVLQACVEPLQDINTSEDFAKAQRMLQT